MTDSKKKTETETLTLGEILNLSAWSGIEEGVYVNIVRNVKNRKKTFTILFNKEHPEGKPLPLTLFVPPDTQPSVGFMKIKPPTLKEVFDSLVKKYRLIMFYDNQILHEVLALAAMCTYFREAFMTYPYIDHQGPEPDSGKTTGMLCLIYSSFYGFVSTDPTGPVLFRAIDNCHATVGIDEIDNVIVDPEKRTSILGILNSSCKKGVAAYRTNKDTFQPEPFDPFGLKTFTRIKGLPGPLLTRCITFLCIRAPMSMSQLEGPEVFREERDKMYWLRLNIMDEVKSAQAQVFAQLNMKNRDREKWVSLLTMARLISDELFERMEKWAEKSCIFMSEAAVDEVKRALVEALLGLSGNTSVTLISDRFHSLMEEYELIGHNKDGKPKRWMNRTVVRILHELGIFRSPYQEREPGTGRTQVWIDRGRVNALADGTYFIRSTQATLSDTLPQSASQSSQNSQTSREDNEDCEDSEASRDSEARPKKEQVKRKGIIPREVKRFEQWLSRLPNAGQRGFKESDIKKAHGEKYLDGVSKYEKKDWIEQRGDNEIWWISNIGKAVLRGMSSEKSYDPDTGTLSGVPPTSADMDKAIMGLFDKELAGNGQEWPEGYIADKMRERWPELLEERIKKSLDRLVESHRLRMPTKGNYRRNN